MSRKERKSREIRTDAAVTQEALDRRKASELEEESVAERVRQSISAVVATPPYLPAKPPSTA